MKRVVLLSCLLAVSYLFQACSGSGDGPTPEEATLVHRGEAAPEFSLQTLSGEEFDLSAERGKIVLLSFFATWCPPCREELPHLEKEIWQKYRQKNFRLLAIGREHTMEELKPFVGKLGIGFPVAADPERTVFSLYAEAFIPRLFLIGTDGRVLFECSGFQPESFEEMKKILSRALNAGDGEGTLSDEI